MSVLFTGAPALSIPVPISQGGTGQITASSAINALLPDQLNHENKVLATDGTNVFWATSVAAAAGLNTQVQFNDGGLFNGAASFTYDKMSGALTSGSYVGAGLNVSGPMGANRAVTYQTSGVDRWVAFANTDPEVGLNSGSDFTMTRVFDDGASRSPVFTISRATGVVDFKVAPTVNGGVFSSASGSVTSVAATGNNGISVTGSPITDTGTLTFGLGAITPASVAAIGTVAGSNLSGTNTGDQTITLTGDVTGTGTGSFVATLANTGVTAGTYGSASAIPVFNVDTKGRITSVSLSNISSSVTSVAGRTGAVVLTPADVGLGNVNNTADADKPMNTATMNALGGKQDTLVSGTNIKTLNGTSLLGSGDLAAVTSVAATGTHGVTITGSPITSTGTIDIGLGAITPTSVAATGAVSGSNLSGTNTGDQTITLTGDVTGSGIDTIDAVLTDSGVVAGTYGSGSLIPVIHVDSKGRIISVSTSGVDGSLAAGVVTSVAGRTGAVLLTKADISGINNVDNTADAVKNVATAGSLVIARTINNVPFDGSANITINAVDATARIAMAEKGAALGVVPLGANSKIDAVYLPSAIDQVVEFANVAAFPATGTPSTIYLDTTANTSYRWSGTGYSLITSGAVQSVAGKTGTVVLTKNDVGLGNVDNTTDLGKPISTATQTALNLKQNLLIGVAGAGQNIKTINGATLLGTGDLVTGDVTLVGTQTLTNKTIAGGVFTQGYTEQTVVSNSGGAFAIALSNGSIQIITLTAACTFTFPTPAAGKQFTLMLKQDATGTRLATWPTTVRWPGGTAPTLTTTAAKTDVFSFICDGTFWLGFPGGLNFSLV